MPNISQGKKQYETPQVTPDQLATKIYGDMAPDRHDIIKSANARAQKRHEMKRQELADVETLPESAQMIGDEMVGVRDNGYLAKKGLEFGVNAFYNTLPPGTDIEDQELSDIRKMEMVAYDGGLGYKGDGWSKYKAPGSQLTRSMDDGRSSETTYLGKHGV